jgi:transposase
MSLYRKRLQRVAQEKYTPANLLRTLRFLIFRELLNLNDCCWVDETGIHDVDVRRLYGRAQGVKRARIAQQYVKRAGRVNIVGAVMVTGMLPCTLPFRGCMKGWLFEWWCLHMLLPCLRPGQTVIMDNAAFHRKNILRPMFALAGVNLLFLPAYSPEFNPIELVWGYMKALLNRYAFNSPFRTAYILLVSIGSAIGAASLEARQLSEFKTSVQSLLAFACSLMIETGVCTTLCLQRIPLTCKMNLGLASSYQGMTERCRPCFRSA